MSDEELLKLCDEVTNLARALKSRLREGWVMVPEEPTEEMLAVSTEPQAAVFLYRAMLAARPKESQ